ncbi:uncharacterized protein LOC124160741 [Ischnura elegans]|uniref:uncharacterized protein LOC124160741 n=1 Tax=Ischnura elegans TaxID=197161 RepID=UPI001ED871A1|nr:uncharacterized protein LOC124160741 [Ischnura elegans]
MTEEKITPFEFKIPAIPSRPNINVIPTGKQIPRTPVKIEKEIVKVEENVKPVAVVFPTVCHNGLTQKKKNWIPKGKEIPRTPLNKMSPEQSSSSDPLAVSLSEVDLGVKPLCEPNESDLSDFKVEVAILTGKINLREKKPVKVEIDQESESASKENKACVNSSKICKARSRGKSVKDTSEQLCKDMETKCVLATRTQLQDISVEETFIRRNPSRRAKAKVNYKL